MNDSSLTSFSRLSPIAQDLIVNAIMGEYNDNPPEMTDEVRAEIAAWIVEKEEG